MPSLQGWFHVAGSPLNTTPIKWNPGPVIYTIIPPIIGPGALIIMYDNESWKLGDLVHIIIILYFQISLISIKT